ncbi:MAG: methyltransferase domain-containing protein [Verrucomicrobiota bacterium]
MDDPLVIVPRDVRNLLYKAAGAGILLLNKFRHAVAGYTTPRTFPSSDFDRAAAYDIQVVDRWLRRATQYLGADYSLHGKTVLELGPGADLGTGLYLFYRGAGRYHALDANPLASNVQLEFYEHLIRKMKGLGVPGCMSDAELFVVAAAMRTGQGERLNYACRPDFSFSAFAAESADLILSQAAFEHFSDIEKAIGEMSTVAKPGALLVAEVDLSTHSRWIRDRDPLNIYRYGDGYYGLCRFRGSPNRIRPRRYVELLVRNGWQNVRAIPTRVLEREYVARVESSLNGAFRGPENEMACLSTVLCATRPASARSISNAHP